MNQLTVPASEAYELIDSGKNLRLERFGVHTVVRPEPNAIWDMTSPSHPAWNNPDLRFEEEAEGHWICRKDNLWQGWEVSFDTGKALVKPTPFRHVGVFPEQAANWQWIQEKLKGRKGAQVLNLFGYTGLASIAAARVGAQVTHVDAAKGTVHWASENARRSGLNDKGIRWIVDDVQKFVQREVRRGATYDLIIMDPPVFGRGSKGEVWRLEDDLPVLLKDIRQIMSKDAVGFLLNIYATSLYPEAVARVAADSLACELDIYTLSLEETESKKTLQSGYSIRSR